MDDDTYVNQIQPGTVTAQTSTEQRLSEEKISPRTLPTDGRYSQSVVTKQPQPDFWQFPTAATQPQMQYPTAEAQYHWYPPQQDYYPTQYQQYPQPQQQQQQSQTVVVVNNQTSRNGQQQNVEVWSSGLCACLEDMNSCKRRSVSFLFEEKVAT